MSSRDFLQRQELLETITDLEYASVFGRSGNTLENIMVYKTRIGLELSHLAGSELDIMAYCHEEWKYFTKTYPNVEPEILPSIKYLLKYDECVTFFSEENIEKRRLAKELFDLRESCKTTGIIFQTACLLFFGHLAYCLTLMLTPWTFIGVVHLSLFLLWTIFFAIGTVSDQEVERKRFNQKVKELGYELPPEPLTAHEKLFVENQ